MAVEALCRADANLIMADALIKLTLNKLLEKRTSIASKLAQSLTHRIKERRTDISSVLQFLQTGTTPSANHEIFKKLSKKDLAASIRDFVNRMYQYQASPSKDSSSELSNERQELGPVGVEVDTTPAFKRKRTELQLEFDKAIEEANKSVRQEPCPKSKNLLGTIEKEVGLYHNGGTRGRYLQLIYECLRTIQPTSVESERAFSCAGSLCSKIRSRLNDQSLDELCFLRRHFQNLEHKRQIGAAESKLTAKKLEEH